MTHQRLFDCQTFLPASLPASLLPPSCLLPASLLSPTFPGAQDQPDPPLLTPFHGLLLLSWQSGQLQGHFLEEGQPAARPSSVCPAGMDRMSPPTNPPPPRAAQVFGETWPVLRPPSSGGSQGQASQLDGVGFWRDPAERYRAAEPVEGAGGLGVSTKGSRACQGSLAKSKVNSKGGLQGKTWIPGAPTCCLWAGRPPSVPGSSLDLGTCRPF